MFNSFLFSGIKIPRAVTTWVAQRQLPDFIEKLYHATLRYANNKTLLNWRENRDAAFEYSGDVRLDEFEQNNGEEEENVEDNLYKKKKRDSKDSSDDIEIDEGEPNEVQTNSKSWWSYFLPYNYLH